MSAKRVDYIVNEHYIGIETCNYVSNDKSEGYYPFLDRYEQLRDEKKYRDEQQS